MNPSTLPLRVVFFGTAELASATLRQLAGAPFVQLLAVVAQPDKPQGRDLKLTPPPVKVLAEELKLPVLQPVKARAPEFVAQLAEIRPDLIVVAAYGQILPRSILDLPKHGCLNVHTSLLPKHRGAAPIQWAIANGDAVTGVTIMKMDAGLDTGPMLAKAETAITPEDTGATLHDRLAQMGGELLVQTLPRYVRGEITPEPQGEGATYARKITKEDGFLNWSRPAKEVWNHLRAFTPWPGGYTFEPGSNARLKIHQAAVASASSGAPGEILPATKGELLVRCAEGALSLLVVQREGGRRMTAAEYLAGRKLQPGERFPLPPGSAA